MNERNLKMFDDHIGPFPVCKENVTLDYYPDTTQANKDVVVETSGTDDTKKEDVIIDDGKYLPSMQQEFKKGKLGTNINVKRKEFDKFVELIRNQFEHGGLKYKDPDECGREFTDLICDAFPGNSGVDWVLGTMMKYLGRFKNFRREKDLLKVATYCYIVWLKFGFHKREANLHDEDLYTTDLEKKTTL